MLENRLSRKRVLWNLLLLFPVLLVCLFTACGEEGDSPIEPNNPVVATMSVTPDTLVVEAQGCADKTFQLTFNNTSSFFAKSNQDWCVLKSADGSGRSSYSVSVEVQENNTADERVAKIAFHSGELTQYAYVVQKVYDKVVATMTPDTLYLSSDAGSKGEIVVKTNKPHSPVTSRPEWTQMTVEQNSDKTEFYYEIITSSENTGKDRVGKFTFSTHDSIYSSCVIQRGIEQPEDDNGNSNSDNNEYKITINPNSCNFTNKGGLSDFEVIVDKETTISIESNADWCTISDNYGESYYNTPSTAFKMAIKAAENIGESRTATVTVRAGKSTATCTITQDAYVTGENKIGGTIADAVDLGLSVKWASHNLGASKETEAGAYLFWGYLEESEYYNEENYRYYDNTYEKYLEVATNICGTKYDAAFHHWGNNWRMPTKAECDELLKKCTWEWVRINNTNGYRVTGPNGKHIFLPAWGYQLGKYNKNKENKEVIIWSGESTSADNRYAYTIKGRSDEKERQQHERIFGLNIRPVK